MRSESSAWPLVPAPESSAPYLLFQSSSAADHADALEGQVGDTKTVIDDAKEFIGAFNSEIKAQSGGVKAPDKSV